MSKHLTYEQCNMLDYFHHQRDDMTRWTEWPTVEPILREHYPEVIAAMAARHVAERTLEAVVAQMLKDEER